MSKKKIINISLIMLMVMSFSIFAVYEIKNKGKVEKAQLQQEGTVPQAVIEEDGNDDKQLEKIFQYYKYDLKKEIFEKYFVKNKGEDLKYRSDSFPHGLVISQENGITKYEYTMQSIYPVINIKSYDIQDTYKEVAVEDGKSCIKLTIELKNTTDEDMYCGFPSYAIGITRDNYSFKDFEVENHYTLVEPNDNCTFYKRYTNDNSNNGTENIIGILPCEEYDDITNSVKISPHSSVIYYEYYKIDKDWIGDEKLAYGNEGALKQRVNGEVRYSVSAFLIYIS